MKKGIVFGLKLLGVVILVDMVVIAMLLGCVMRQDHISNPNKAAPIVVKIIKNS